MSTHSRLVDDRAARHDGELEMSEVRLTDIADSAYAETIFFFADGEIKREAVRIGPLKGPTRMLPWIPPSHRRIEEDA